MALEIMSPAGSFESVVAAVRSGADAVYFGAGDFNARRNAKNLSDEELAEAIRYCHLRGVKTYITVNTLVTDRELEKAKELLRQGKPIKEVAALVGYVQYNHFLRVFKQREGCTIKQDLQKVKMG